MDFFDQHTINVTYKDIESGRKGNCRLCPVAKAVTKHFKPLKAKVHVGLIYVTIEVKCRLYRIFLPVEAQRFIMSFDHDGFYEPFSFELDLRELRLQ